MRGAGFTVYVVLESFLLNYLLKRAEKVTPRLKPNGDTISRPPALKTYLSVIKNS